jgi:hypothetical protein
LAHPQQNWSIALKEIHLHPHELENIRLTARVVAIEGVLSALINALVHSKDARQDLAKVLDQWSRTYEPVHFPGRTAEYSDLYSSELKSSIESLIAFLKSQLMKS